MEATIAAGAEPKQMKLQQFIPLSKWSKHFAYPTLPSLRWMVYRAEHHGLTHCIKRIGRRIWIDHKAFWEWMARH